MRIRSWMLVTAGVLIQIALMTGVLVQALQAEGAGKIVGVVVTGSVLLLSVIAGIVAAPAAGLLYYGRNRLVAMTLLILIAGALLVWTQGGPAFVTLQVFFALGVVQAWRERGDHDIPDSDHAPPD